MDCILFRHGIAVPYEGSCIDHERSLTQEGIDKTRLAVSGLIKLGITPTHLFSSPYVRAVETATFIHDHLQGQLNIHIHEDLVPHGEISQVFLLLRTLPPDSCIICVGHEPHLGLTAGIMLSGKPVLGLSLKKSGSCCIHFESEPTPGHGILRWWLSPSQLRHFGRISE